MGEKRRVAPAAQLVARLQSAYRAMVELHPEYADGCCCAQDQLIARWAQSVVQYGIPQRPEAL